MKGIRPLIVIACILLITAVVSVSLPVFATSSNTLKYYLGEVVNAGRDTGYSKADPIKTNDPHYGWRMGRFSVSGYTRVITDKGDNPIFLKTVGDKVQLSFILEQDLDALNGDSSFFVHEDQNGYDSFFEIPKTDFGRGTLIVRKTNYENETGEPQVFTDYLSALTTDADTFVGLFEEGDYEVALNYELRKDPRVVFGYSLLPEYNNYRIFFGFSVRNGNSMVYPFDVETGAELTTTSITENGFYLDLAKSRYLDIDIKKEVLTAGARGLTEDTRFNRPAKDGDEYIEDGIYTITVNNRYTNQKTTKVIYVGSDRVLMAHVVTGLSIDEIKDQVAKGATISSDGTIVAAPVATPTPTPSPTTSLSSAAATTDGSTITTTHTTTLASTSNLNSVTQKTMDMDTASSDNNSPSSTVLLIVLASVLVVGAAIVIVRIKTKRK